MNDRLTKLLCSLYPNEEVVFSVERKHTAAGHGSTMLHISIFSKTVHTKTPCKRVSWLPMDNIHDAKIDLISIQLESDLTKLRHFCEFGIDYNLEGAVKYGEE